MAEAADLAEGVAEMEAAVAVFNEELASGTDGSASLVARAAYRLGLAYMQQIHFPQAEALTAETARLESQGFVDPAALGRLHGLHAWAVAAQGREDGSLDEAAAAAALAAESGDPVAELETLDHRLATSDEIGRADPDGWGDLAERARAGRLQPLRALVDRAVASAAEADTGPLMRASTALIAAVLAEATGDSDSAEINAKLALEHASPIGAAWWQSRALRILGSDAEAQALERSVAAG